MIRTKLLHYFTLITFLVLNSQYLIASEAVSINKSLSDATEAEFRVFKAQGKHVILWISPEFGFRKGHFEMAELLSNKGIEVWLLDVADMLFMTRGSRSMKELSGKYVADAMIELYKETGKNITLMSSFYGAIPVLRGANKWQQTNPDKAYLTGAILFTPVLYKSIPLLGQNPEYLPITHATNIPIMIFQGANTGMRWQLPILLDNLHKNGSRTHSQLMPNITSLFYKETRAPQVDKYFKSIPGKINSAFSLLQSEPAPTRALPVAKAGEIKLGFDIELTPYKGLVKPDKINLASVDNKTYIRNDFKGKVSLINFWATWCPPCVEEIPSLNDLAKNINHPDFEILSINFAETPETINKFLTHFKVDYPILLDPDGSLSRQWKVLAFPSTYIIGKDGKIRYGVNAAIDWNTEMVNKKIRELLDE